MEESVSHHYHSLELECVHIVLEHVSYLRLSELASQSSLPIELTDVWVELVYILNEIIIED